MRVARRNLLIGSLGLVTAASLGKPALAKGQTVTVWWNQGSIRRKTRPFAT